MDELVNQIAQKTGVGAETVQKVLHSAVEMIKTKLPPQFASQVDSLLSGGGMGGGQSGGAGGGLGGMLGGMMGGGGK